MASWREVVAFSQPLTVTPREGSNDQVVSYGVMQPLPVIVLDPETKQRRIVPMRWGFAEHPKGWKIPKPMHARSEGIDVTKSFAQAFRDGQRGIVVFRTFNEGEEVPTKTGKMKTIQHTIDPGDGIPRGFPFIWRRFEIADLPQPMLACVMVTVPANELIRRTIMQNQDDPRMPAILADEDWAKWLGEETATAEELKSTLKTMEGVKWTIAPEPKLPKKS